MSETVDVFTTITNIVAKIMGVVGTVLETVIANPILLIGCTFSVIFGCVSLFKRLKG